MAEVPDELPLPDGLRSARQRLGLTQDELATRAGVSVRAVRELERGRVAHPQPATVRRLAAALRVPAVDASWPDQVDGSRLLVLGAFLVVQHGEPVVVVSTRRANLLALLALNANTPVGVADLLELVWPDLARPTPDLLHTQVSRLRRLLGAGGPRLERVGGGYQLSVDDAHLDLLAFRRFARQAWDAWQLGRTDEAFDWWARCWRLWRGAPLADLPALAGQPAAAAVLREITGTALRHADAALEREAVESALEPLTALAGIDPLDEAVIARLVRVLAAMGRQAHAIDVYHRIRQSLADELGVGPGAALQAAFAAVLRADDAAEAPGAAQDRWTVPAQLPADVADFTGRAEELAQIRRLCRPGASTTTPIVVISAAGGAGKTTLAVHAGQLLRPAYPDGQLYVDLRGTGSIPAAPADVLRRLLTALGVLAPDEPEPAAALLRSVLADRRVLMLLDDARDAAQVRSLLPAGAGCAVLITSRRRLADLSAAHHVALSPMSVEESTDLLGRIAGAGRIGADAAATHRLVAACDGFPLATRIAGARLAARPQWTVTQFADRLSDTRRRVSELAVGDLAVGASFRLSYNALTTPQARAFRLLGIWPGADISEPAAAALLDLSPTETEDLLEHLVDVHLLTSVALGRYRMHDLIRDYAGDLAGSVDPPGARAETLRRAVRHSAAMAESAVRYAAQGDTDNIGVDERFPTDAAVMAWLTTEYTNLTALIRLCHEGDLGVEPAAAAYLLLALCNYDQDRLDEQTAERHAREALTFAEAAAIPSLVARACNMVGRLLLNQFRNAEAEPLLRRALTGFRSIGDPRGETTATVNLGLMYLQTRQWDAARDHLTRALATAERRGNRENQALALLNLGVLAGIRGDFAPARDLFSEALLLARQLNNPRLINTTEMNLGCAWRDLGELDQAEACFTATANRARQDGARAGLGWALFELATTHRMAGDHERARDHCLQSLRILRHAAARYEQAQALIELGHLAVATGQPTNARPHWIEARDILLGLGTAEADDVETLLTGLSPETRQEVGESGSAAQRQRT